jgi:hypothetical protein
LRLCAEVGEARVEYNNQTESLRSRQLDTHRRLEYARQRFFEWAIETEGRAGSREQNTKNHIEVQVAESNFKEAEQNKKTVEESMYKKELRLLVALIDIHKEIIKHLEQDGNL